MVKDSDNKFALAIDLGSGGPKVGIVSTDGSLITTARRATETLFLPAGGVEQDPEGWWQAISDAAREVLSRRVVPVKEIVAVGCTSQWSVTTPVDRQGRPLMNAVHWMDARGAPYTREITSGFPRVAGYGLLRLVRWLRLSGGAPTHTGADVLAHILYIKRQRPDLYQRTYKLLEPADYVNLRLTGRFAASYGTIFPYLLTDNRDNLRIDYSDSLIRLSGVDRDKLPDLVPVDAVLGPLLRQVADDWGLDPGVQVVAGSCDSQAAILGSGAVGDYQGHICVGTSSWLTCHVPFKRTDILRYVATMPAAVRGRNMVVAEQGAAGKCLEVFLRQWLFHDVQRGDSDGVFSRALELAAEAPAGSNGLLFLPWLNGAGPPGGEAYIRGGFLNQTLRTSRQEAIRAVLEGVSYNLRWLIGAVERLVGRRFEVLNHIGGGARSELWCQIHADVMNRPIRQVEQPTDAILRGAGLLALMTLKHIRLDDLAQRVPITRTFEPQPDLRAVYDKMFAAFVKSYKANQGLFKRLNRDVESPT